MGALKAIREGLEPSENRISREKELIYAPMVIAPFGMTMTVNVLGSGPKACSFDCGYCDLGRTFTRLNRLKGEIELPSLESIKLAIDEAFKKIHAEGPVIDSILISGNGEPTLHPEFPEIVRLVLEARKIWTPGKPIRVMTNGYALDSRKITDAMNMLDERIVKIDAGNEKMFKLVNSPLSRTNLARVLNGVKKLRDVTVQTMLMKGPIDNTNKADLDDWMEVIAMIKPKGVILQAISRPSAMPELTRLTEDQIYGIASMLERRVQIKAVVLP
jgi:wyosine [tRNA(Phe)-imidazoG37] synthetase (radical SAM superfamily)